MQLGEISTRQIEFLTENREGINATLLFMKLVRVKKTVGEKSVTGRLLVTFVSINRYFVSRQQAIENIEGCFNEIKLNIILFIQKGKQHFMTMASASDSL